MSDKPLIEVKTARAILFLTQEEYINALKRGKAILRQRKLSKRMTDSEGTNATREN